MSDVTANYTASSFEHAPNVLGWQLNVPEFANHTKLAFVRLVLAAEATVLTYIKTSENDRLLYTTRNYDDDNQGTRLGRGTYYAGQSYPGYLMGFPILHEVKSEKSMLGIEICGDPNDIYATNATFRMQDVVQLAVAPHDQAVMMQRLENELIESVGTDETRFMHPEPVLLYRKTGEKLYRPMSLDERESVRLSLPYSYDSIQPVTP